jgi:prefoldin subunit 5
MLLKEPSMSETYIEKRLTDLHAEIQQIDSTIPQLQNQLTTLTQRRLLLQGAFLELQDLQKQTQTANGHKEAELAEPVTAEVG